MSEEINESTDGNLYEPDEEEVDKYGNPISGDRLIYCCFPDCGCDGARLCGAEQGASNRAIEQNVEGMYGRRDRVARIARQKLIESVMREKSSVGKDERG
jgi:hypothetical protein